MTRLWAPWALAAALAGGLIASFLVVQWALGRAPFGPAGGSGEAGIAIVHCLILAYLIGAYAYVGAGARQATAALRGHVDQGNGDLEATLAAVGRYPRPTLVLLSVVGAAVALAGPYLTGPGDVAYWNPREWTAEVFWHRILGLGIGLGISWLGVAMVMESLRLSRLAGSLGTLSLWDHRPLGPFTRQGLRNALVAIGLVSVFALFVPAQGVTRAFILILGIAAGLALVGLILPLGGAHRAIREAKSRELAWAADMIERERAALEGGTAAAGRLADLLSYRESVERVREWPFDQSTLLRMMLYLLVPIGSLLASGLLERLFDRLLSAAS